MKLIGSVGTGILRAKERKRNLVCSGQSGYYSDYVYVCVCVADPALITELLIARIPTFILVQMFYDQVIADFLCRCPTSSMYIVTIQALLLYSLNMHRSEILSLL